MINPAALAITNRIQFARVTKFNMRFWISTKKSLLRLGPVALKPAYFLDGNADVSKPGNNSKSKKNQRKPWRCFKAPINIKTDKKTDKNSQRNRKTHAAEISKFPKMTPGFPFHSKRIPLWIWQMSSITFSRRVSN